MFAWRAWREETRVEPNGAGTAAAKVNEASIAMPVVRVKATMFRLEIN
jgi:hypothetical protein